MRPTCVRLICVLASLAVPLGVAPAASAATTRTVCATGCDFTVIQDAVTASVADDVIEVRAGTYPADFTVNKKLTITGAKVGVDARTRTTDDGETIITGLVGVGAPLELDGVYLNRASGQALFANDNVTLRNARVRGSGDVVEALAVVDPLTVIVDRSSISLIASGSALLLDDVDTATVTNSTFSAPTTGTNYGVEEVGAGGTFSITTNSFSNFDRALWTTGLFGATAAFRLNHVVRQTTASDGVYSTAATAIDATDNLWGCGTSVPTTTGTCDVVGGTSAATVATTPYLVVSPSSAVTPVPPSVATAVSASLTRQDGTAPGGSLVAFEGANVTFAVTATTASTSPAQGTLSATTASMVNGVASVPFTPPVEGGTLVLRTMLDGIKYTRSIETRGVVSVATVPAHILGTPRFRTQLSCATTWSRVGAVSTAWLRNGVVIAGASAATYTPVLADIGTKLSCVATSQPANTDLASSTSPAVKVLKRHVTLAILQSSITGVGLKCGTARKPCVHKRTGPLYIKVQPHATLFAGMKVQVVLEQKVGRRWIPRKPILLTVGRKSLIVRTAAMPVGAYRIRVRLPVSKTDDAVSSGYRYLKLKA
ncbi:MAG: hypothetical protein JWL76_691 [Thermoleophilia bacterium]|nr:hypothetical protein [Thermoleophilia bacterium]